MVQTRMPKKYRSDNKIHHDMKISRTKMSQKNQTNPLVLFIFLIPDLWLWGKHRLHHFRQCTLHIQKHSLWPSQIHFRTWKFQIHFAKKHEWCWWFDLPKPIIIWVLTGQWWGSLGETQGNFVIHALLPLLVSLHIWKGAQALLYASTYDSNPRIT